MLRVSAGGEALYCNPAAAKLEGWKCEIGRPTPNPIMPLVRKAMAEGRKVMQDVDLGERTYFVAVTSFPAEGYANVYGRDITERKQAEEETARRSGDFSTAVLDTAGAMVIVLDKEGRITRFNRACEVITGTCRQRCRDACSWNSWSPRRKKFRDVRQVKMEKSFARRGLHKPAREPLGWPRTGDPATPDHALVQHGESRT